MEKKPLLIIDKHPFGSLTDTLKWCEYAREYYSITLLCFDDDKRLTLDGIKIKRVSYSGGFYIRGARFITRVIAIIQKSKGSVFVEYFPGCSILKRLFPNRNIHVDIRTLSVAKSLNERDKYNKRLIQECRCFDSVSSLSEGIIKKIKIPNAYLLPLGSDVINSAEKKYDESIRLLYVGTLNNRDIYKTIEGVTIFHENHPDISISYTIIGSGLPQEELFLSQKIHKSGLENLINFIGRVEYNELSPYYANANIGVSFVPITDYYDFQPPTKTYEYLRSGLYCIATKTLENIRIISPDVGVLINDDPEDFAKGLEEYWKNKNRLNFQFIYNSLTKYSWKNIVIDYFLPIIENNND